MEEIKSQLSKVTKRFTVLQVSIVVVLIAFFVFFPKMSGLFQGFIGAGVNNTGEFDVQVTKALVTAIDGTECLVAQPCKVMLRFKKTLAGTTGLNLQAFIEFNGQLLPQAAGLSQLNALGANEGDATNEISGLQFPNAIDNNFFVVIKNGDQELGRTPFTFEAKPVGAQFACSANETEFIATQPFAIDQVEFASKILNFDFAKKFNVSKMKVDSENNLVEQTPPLNIINGAPGLDINSSELNEVDLNSSSKVIPISEKLNILNLSFGANFFNGSNHPYNITSVKVCASPSPDRGAAETCNNGIDDDADGATDCGDAYCSFTNQCSNTIESKVSTDFSIANERGIEEETPTFEANKPHATMNVNVENFRINDRQLKINKSEIYNPQNELIGKFNLSPGEKNGSISIDTPGFENLAAGDYKYILELIYPAAGDALGTDGPVKRIEKTFRVTRAAAQPPVQPDPPEQPEGQPLIDFEIPDAEQPQVPEEESEEEEEVPDDEDEPEDDEEDDDEQDEDNEPPSLSLEDVEDFEDADDSDLEIEITDDEANPQRFNPLIAETDISYNISDDAKIEFKILDSRGQTVITITENQEFDAGAHRANWNGTADNSEDGEVVPAGIYTYRIEAKAPGTDTVKDSASGDIEVAYEPAGETVVPAPTPTQTPTPPTNTNRQNTNPNNSFQPNSVKVNTLQTAATGPEALFYLLFPAIGYIITRRKK